MNSILDFCPPGVTLRDNQVDILLQIEANWSKFDAFVLSAAVGSGKSLIALIVARWANFKGLSAGILTHRVSLQDQYEQSFPDVPTLRGVSRYMCKDYQMSCGDVKELFEGKYCSSACSYSCAKTKVAAAQTAVYNYQTYIYNEIERPVVICDEAHTAFDIMSEMYAITCWKHKEHYPDSLQTCGDLAVWLERRSAQIVQEIQLLVNTITAAKVAGQEPVKADIRHLRQFKERLGKYRKILNGLQIAPANFFIEHTMGDYRGKQMPMLRVRPTTLQGLPPLLWGKETKKVILMSGTIGAQDVSKLGMRTLRVKYIYGQNPIPADVRPVDVSWGVNMAAKHQDANLPELAKRIQELADRYADVKGLCHLTYDLAKKLRPLLPSNRYIWHTSETSETALKQFLGTKENKILMACGREEGLDLPGPEYGWQAILKIPWPNRTDKLVDKWYREDMDWIHWLTVRKLRQMCGRVVRGPEHKKTTYILDSGFGNPPKRRWGLVNQAREMFGQDFMESVKW